MMFEGLKKLFHISKREVGSELSKINNSLTYIPTMNELDKESRKKVLDYYKKIDISNYESLVKYSYDLVKLADIEYETFLKASSDLKKLPITNKKISKADKLAYTYHYINLVAKRYEATVQELIKIRKEVTLRYKALNMFIDKQKLNAFNVFNRNERVKAKMEMNRLSFEQERLLTFITCIDHIYRAIMQSIQNSKALKEQQDILFQAEGMLNSKEPLVRNKVGETLANEIANIETYTLPRELKKYFYSELEKIIYGLEGLSYKDDFNFDGSPLTKKKIKERFDVITAYGDSFPSPWNWEWLTYTAPNDMLDKIYSILGDCFQKLEVYRHEHYYDYEKYFQEMDFLYNLYASTIPIEWDKDYLEKELIRLAGELGDYIRFYGFKRFGCTREDRIIGDKLREKFYRLAFFYAGINGVYKTEKLIKDATRDCELSFSIVDLNHTLVELTEELIKKVESKYQISFPFGYEDYDYEYNWHSRFEDHIEWFLREAYSKNVNMIEELYLLLHDIDDFTKYDITIRDQYTLIDYIKNAIKDIPDASVNIYYDYFNRFRGDISIEEIFYIMKYLLPPDEDFKLKWYGCNSNTIIEDENRKISLDQANFYMSIQQSKIESKYDPRIIVVPKTIVLDNANIMYLFNKEKEDAMALYVSTYDQFKMVYSKCVWEYIFVDEDLYEKLDLVEQMNDAIKVIPIPNISHYDELSNYLDMELEKNDNKNQKVLEKVS